MLPPLQCKKNYKTFLRVLSSVLRKKIRENFASSLFISLRLFLAIDIIASHFEAIIRFIRFICKHKGRGIHYYWNPGSLILLYEHNADIIPQEAQQQ
jgi:hypothetical protein